MSSWFILTVFADSVKITLQALDAVAVCLFSFQSRTTQAVDVKDGFTLPAEEVMMHICSELIAGLIKLDPYFADHPFSLENLQDVIDRSQRDRRKTVLDPNKDLLSAQVALAFLDYPVGLNPLGGYPDTIFL